MNYLGRWINIGPEKKFENKVKRFLKDHKCWVLKYFAGGQFGVAGVPDILVCNNGVFMGIEVKAEKGSPSPLQLHTIKQINNAGGVAFVLYPKDFEVFKNLIRYIEKTGKNDKNISDFLEVESNE